MFFIQKLFEWHRHELLLRWRMPRTHRGPRRVLEQHMSASLDVDPTGDGHRVFSFANAT